MAHLANHSEKVVTHWVIPITRREIRDWWETNAGALIRINNIMKT